MKNSDQLLVGILACVKDHVIRFHSKEMKDVDDTSFREEETEDYGQYRLKVYQPNVYAHLRYMSDVMATDFVSSFTPEFGMCEVLQTSGRSGAFFYQTWDKKYIIKSITGRECKFEKKIIKDYYNYMLENRKTFIVQIYGFFRIQMSFGQKNHFIVMKNILAADTKPDFQFDLKGSFVGRSVSVDTQNISKKDCEFVKKKWVSVGPKSFREFVKQLNKDVAFLERMGSMDYSFLIGGYEVGASCQGGFRATDGFDKPLPQVYYMGIIDFFQEYNAAKFVEHNIKSILYPPTEVSCIPPHDYANRFKRFLIHWFKTDHQDENSEVNYL